MKNALPTVEKEKLERELCAWIKSCQGEPVRCSIQKLFTEVLLDRKPGGVPALRGGDAPERYGRKCGCNEQKGRSAHAATIACHFSGRNGS